MDTDSFIIIIETEDFYEDISIDVEILMSIDHYQLGKIKKY